MNVSLKSCLAPQSIRKPEVLVDSLLKGIAVGRLMYILTDYGVSNVS